MISKKIKKWIFCSSLIVLLGILADIFSIYDIYKSIKNKSISSEEGYKEKQIHIAENQMIQGNAPEACRIIESLKKKYPNDKQIDLLQASFRKNAYTIYLCRLNFFSISERYKYLDDLIKLYPEKTQELEYVKKYIESMRGKKKYC